MQYIADAKEAKEIDGISIKQIGIPSFVLMERAAMKVADCVYRVMDHEHGKVLAICGMGNNGGDGVAAARILMERGCQVELAYIGNKEHASEEMMTQMEIASKLSIPIADSLEMEKYDVIIDAIFGIGLSREIKGEYHKMIQQINQSGAHVVSVDIPSGVDATTGKVFGIAVKADDTVTFGVNKRGLVLFPGAQYAGKVHVEEIGFPKKALEEVSPKVISYERDDILKIFPKRIPCSNKGTYGRILVIAGSEHMGGAALFAALAAYRMGSGLVKVFTHENNRVMLQIKLPEALLTTYGQAASPKEEWEQIEKSLQAAIEWATTIVIGPGLGTSCTAKKMLDIVLKQKDIPTVIDADGLNLLAEDRKYFDTEKKLSLSPNFVLTPHVKEMSRLTGKNVADIKENIIESAKNPTGQNVIVLKDARTVVYDGSKDRTYLNLSGNNALAKGGSGDVLSGMIGGLLALQMSPFEAASLGVYLHGLTAEEYVKERGYSSMLASDILEELKKLLL